MKANTSPVLMLGIGLVVGIIVVCASKDSGQTAAGKKETFLSRDLSELKLSRDADDAFVSSVQELQQNGGVKLSLLNAAQFQRIDAKSDHPPRFFMVPSRDIPAVPVFEPAKRELESLTPSHRRPVNKDLIDQRYQPPEIELPN